MGAKEGWIGHRARAMGCAEQSSLRGMESQKSAVSKGEGAQDHRILVRCSGHAASPTSAGPTPITRPSPLQADTQEVLSKYLLNKRRVNCFWASIIA